MKFHEFRSMQATHPQEHVRKMSSDTYFATMLKVHSETMNESDNDFGIVQMIHFEFGWRKRRRPFYNVYPAVIKCLSNTKLGFKMTDLGFALRATAICFPVGHEPTIEGRKVESVLFAISQNTLEVSTEDGISMQTVENAVLKKGKACLLLRMNFNDTLNGNRDRLMVSTDDRSIDAWGLGGNTNLVALCVGVAMLARDERFAEQILLAKDANKTFKTEQEREAAIERAKNRGRNGLDIGKDIDTSPHVRRPHFGIRWTEKGRSVPKLVPISGSLVSRSKLYPIPTGYMDEENKMPD